MKESERLQRIERILKYLMIHLYNSQHEDCVDFLTGVYVKGKKLKLPDISDIYKDFLSENRGK